VQLAKIAAIANPTIVVFFIVMFLSNRYININTYYIQ